MIRGFVSFAVDKPIVNHILMVFMLLLAIFSYQNIAKEIFPASQLDKISISGGYMGASADVLDKMVVGTIEDGLKGISSIDTIYTTIQNGSFVVKADIKPGNNTQGVLSDVKDVISNTRRDLPGDMEEPIARIALHDYPVILVAVSGDVEKSALIDAANDLKRELALIEDLSSIDIRGDADDEVLITIDQKKIEAYGLEKYSIYQAITGISSIFPIGSIEEKGNHLYISTINGEKSEEALSSILLRIGDKHVRLGDITSVSIGLEEPSQISHFNGKENISLNINKSKGGNAIALSKEIREALKIFSKKYDNIDFVAYTDTSVWIKNRLNLVSSNILFGLILVFLALVLSVNIRIALVVAIGIPASFMIAIISANFMGYSLNMLSLLGMLIALGMLVDEAIVVAENIYRHLEMGKSPRDAAIDGSLEMFPAVLTATLTTVFAFLPLLIMTGEMGMFMQVLPVMISILLLSSLFEAFYFLPLHAKELFSVGEVDATKKNKSFWKDWIAFYEKLLNALLLRKKLSLVLILGAIILGSIGMSSVTKFQLFPEFDAQQVYMNGKININNELKDTQKYVKKIEEVLLQNLDKNAVSSVTSVIGFKFNQDQSFETGNNLFQIFINLHEKAPENFFDRYMNPVFSLEYDGSDMIREKLSQTIAKEIEKEVVTLFKDLEADGQKVFEEFNVYVQQTGLVGNDIEIGFSHLSESKILDAMEILEKNLRDTKGISDISNNANEGVRELKIRVNEYGQHLGFSESYVVSVLKGSFLKAEYAKMFNKKGLLRLRVEDIHKNDSVKIANFKITSPDKTKVVRLGDISDFIYKKSFVKIFKEDGEVLRSVFASVDKEVITPTEVMNALKPLLESIENMGVTVIIKGEEKESAKVQDEMIQAMIIAMFLIFITLVWMFNSLILPLIILTTIPLSVFGALVGTYLMGINMTMPGMMGIIGLAGVVVNDGLIMLSFIRGSKNYDNMHHKAGMRLRPILLTSATTVLGLSSLIFFASGQALILQPMAISLGFGVLWATVLNLYYVPLMYAVIYRVKP